MCRSDWVRATDMYSVGSSFWVFKCSELTLDPLCGTSAGGERPLEAGLSIYFRPALEILTVFAQQSWRSRTLIASEAPEDLGNVSSNCVFSCCHVDAPGPGRPPYTRTRPDELPSSSTLVTWAEMNVPLPPVRHVFFTVVLGSGDIRHVPR